jgi:hypothetical protein
MTRHAFRECGAGFLLLELLGSVLLAVAASSVAWADADNPFEDAATAQPAAEAVVGARESLAVVERAPPQIIGLRDADDSDLRAEAKIREQLNRPTTMEFVDTPLQDAVDYLKDLHGIEIQLDTSALGDAGVGTDTPITGTMKGISLRSALRLLLGRMSTPLTTVIRDGVLLITTPKAERGMVALQIYDVGDLVDDEDDIEALGKLLQTLLTPPGQPKNKAASESLLILGLHELLFVRAPINDQDEVARILGVIRKKAAEE